MYQPFAHIYLGKATLSDLLVYSLIPLCAVTTITLMYTKNIVQSWAYRSIHMLSLSDNVVRCCSLSSITSCSCKYIKHVCVASAKVHLTLLSQNNLALHRFQTQDCWIIWWSSWSLKMMYVQVFLKYIQHTNHYTGISASRQGFFPSVADLSLPISVR